MWLFSGRDVAYQEAFELALWFCGCKSRLPSAKQGC